ncbi:Putative ribosome biogenesis GTPase RsgA [Planctomycetes bacterium Pan216]|uniref:Small ribosomal subunit biogenesis GTPase RsgA n=1 Tax=Kolteria novifilia TaxID=2527975 RepID=A0A518AZ27_9BACT|nr:Putative ribosome biogenesis GTPase RsgA [Planctomycetes bacterium Pan216]
MSDDITERQLAELGWREEFFTQLTSDEWGRSVVARVVAEHRAHLEVVTAAGTERLSRPLWTRDDPTTVGDWVLIDRETRLLQRFLTRRSLFQRKAPGTARDAQLIAANVDTLFIVTSCNHDFNVARIERYLVLAAEANVTPVLVVTKVDEAEDPQAFRTAAEAIRAELPVCMLNALEAREADRLGRWCGFGETVALVGSSGVGKSTIVNSLLDRSIQRTSGIREDDSKGRHTTSARSMNRLAMGGWLIDTPGMREIQLFDAAEGVAKVFVEIADLARECKFSDCSHRSEPGCAVRRAIEEGLIDEGRLERYMKLEREQTYNSETLAERRSREKRFQKRVNVAVRSKRIKR